MGLSFYLLETGLNFLKPVKISNSFGWSFKPSQTEISVFHKELKKKKCYELDRNLSFLTK